MKIIEDFCIVRVKDIVLDKVPAMTPNGFMFVNPSYDPQRHTLNCGIVESVPNGLTRFPLVGKHVSYPAYHEGNPMFPWKTTEDIELEVAIGDKIYFHYGQLLPDDHLDLYNHQYIKSRKVMENGEEVVYHYFKIRYETIYAAVNYKPVSPQAPVFDWINESKLQEFTTEIHGEDSEERATREKTVRYRIDEHLYEKQVKMIGSWVLLEPDKETWESISLPTPETINGKPVLDGKGKPVYKPQDQWIVTKTHPASRYLVGWVRHIGSPLKGDKCYLQPGDYVYFRPAADTLIRVEGVEYYRLIQRNIYGYVPYVKEKVA